MWSAAKKGKIAKKVIATAIADDYHGSLSCKKELIAAVTIDMADEVFVMVLTGRVNSAEA
jgi:hypothetical protein